MPESLDNPKLTMRKILDLDPNDPRVLKAMADAKADAEKFHEEYVVPFHKRIRNAFPWFTDAKDDWTKIEATLSLKLQKPFNWFNDELSAQDYLAVVDAIAMHEQSQPKPTTDPFELMHDEMKAQKATDKEIAEAWLKSRPPIERSALLRDGKDEVLKSLIRKCTNLRADRKKSAKR